MPHDHQNQQQKAYLMSFSIKHQDRLMSESLTAQPPCVHLKPCTACPLADTFSVGPLSPGII